MARVCARACHTDVAYPPFRPPPLRSARNESSESKTGCNRTLATVLWAPLSNQKEDFAQGDGPKVTDPNLRVPASCCEDRQFSAVLGARQRSGEGVVRRNGRPKQCFWRVRFLSAPLRFSCVLRANLKGAEKKRTLQKHTFWTTVSPHDAFAAPLARSELSSALHMQRTLPY